MSTLPIDLDKEAIQLDGTWYTRDELAQRIKGMLDAGDFAVSRPSQALEQLTEVLGSLRTVAFRSTPELVDALTALAVRQGITVGGVIREALLKTLGLAAAETAAAARPAPAPTSKRPTEPEFRAIVPPNLQPAHGTTGANQPSVVVDKALLAEPATSPGKKKEEESAERRWFEG